MFEQSPHEAGEVENSQNRPLQKGGYFDIVAVGGVLMHEQLGIGHGGCWLTLWLVIAWILLVGGIQFGFGKWFRGPERLRANRILQPKGS